MRRKRKVFIVWAHDPLGKVVVPILDLELRRRGLEVVSDSLLKTTNVQSLPLWMANNIHKHVVIVVVTPELAKWFDPGHDASPNEHKGIRFEIPQLMQRLYEHTAPEWCPVIPVVPLGVSSEDRPMALRGLQNTPFNHITGEGADNIVERVRNVYDHLDGGTRDRTQPATPQSQAGTSRLDRLVSALLTVDSVLTDAPRLAEQWIKQAWEHDTPHSNEMHRVFKKIVRIAHIAGDVSILRDATDICLKAVERLDLDDDTKSMKATYLLSGKVTLLCHSHRVRDAQLVAEEALMLGNDVGDATVVARAKRCLARIHRHLAEITAGPRQREHLTKAREYAEAAMDFFRSIDDEKKLATLVLAEMLFTEFRVLNTRDSFREASRLAEEAAEFFPDRRYHEYYEVKLLQAAIALETSSFTTASKVLDEIVRDLRPRVQRSEAFAELLGEGHLTRARLWVLQNWTEAADEIDNARAIFDKLGLPNKLAACEWLVIRHNHRRHGLEAYDVEAIERLCPDPVERVKVAQHGRDWSLVQDWLGRPGDRNWKRVVEIVRAR